jgi:hypothetical protein
VRRPLTRITLAAYMMFWFGVVIPAHQRGVVTVPGSENCCECCCCQTADAKPSNSQSPQDRSKHCAICDFAAHVTIPPPVDFTLPPLGLLDRLPAQIAHDLISRLVLIPFDGRGPPALV